MTADSIDPQRLRRLAELSSEQASSALSDLLARDISLALDDLSVTTTRSWAEAASGRGDALASEASGSAGQRVAVTQGFFEDFVGEAWVIFPTSLLHQTVEPLGYPELADDPVAPPLVLDVGALLIGALLGMPCRALGLRLNYHAPAVLALSLSAVSLVDASAGRPHRALAFGFRLEVEATSHRLALAWLVSDGELELLDRRLRMRRVTSHLPAGGR